MADHGSSWGAENLITDGPYADAKEVLGGYYVLEPSNVDAFAHALRLATTDAERRLLAQRLAGL